MENKLESLKCPNCGSVEFSLLNYDYYRCNYCSSNFILKKNNFKEKKHQLINTKPQPSQVYQSPKKKKVDWVSIGAWLALFLTISFFILVIYFFSDILFDDIYKGIQILEGDYS